MGDDKIPEHNIDDLSTFLEIVEELADDAIVLFRGQRYQWQLKPKLGRLKPRIGSLIGEEARMLADFKRRSVPLLDFPPANDLEWLAVAQHHGMATRLMDWTENPLAALWFATRNPPEAEEDEPSPGVVW